MIKVVSLEAPAAPVPASAVIGTTLKAGQTLTAGQSLNSADGRFQAVMQGDGNFVVYATGGGAIWSTGTQGNPGARLAMQTDGNLVVYSAAGKPLWFTSTQPSSNDTLVMQNDGNLVIYSGGRALWSIQGGRTPGNRGEAIVRAAASMAGRPYCYGGGGINGPTTRGCTTGVPGFDCSGLAMYAVFQGTGIVLPHGRGMERVQGGTPIHNRSQLQPGDLVFFGGGSLANYMHVGIYAGGGMMWDAANYGIPVQQRSMAWTEHSLPFVGALRFS
jgi:cell wall-associated NlpC family hydrolase